MGLPEGMTAQVTANNPCPPIDQGPGRVVLTTVNHLNPRVVELTLRPVAPQYSLPSEARGRAGVGADAAHVLPSNGNRPHPVTSTPQATNGSVPFQPSASSNQETVRPTAFHKFYSETRAQWLSAEDLQPGETLRGLTGPLQVVSQRPIPGTHRVYNMTVEGEHVYHVSTLGVLAHNTCKLGIRRNPKSGKIEQLLPANGRQASLKGSRWNTAPPIHRRSKLSTGLEDHHAISRSLLEGQNPHDFVRIA